MTEPRVSLADELTLSFEPRTIEHLGLQMYSQLPSALAELIANSFDADANHVCVYLEDDEQRKPLIAVEDDGHGMSRHDLNVKYLTIGRNRRSVNGGNHSESGRRKVSGKKGIGKLALFGIGSRIIVSTSRRHSVSATEVVLDWKEMITGDGNAYKPMTREQKSSEGEHGTRIEIRDLSRKTAICPGNLAKSLARLFNYTGDFELSVVSDGNRQVVTPDLRHEDGDIQFRWSVPDDLPASLGESARFFRENGVKARVFGTTKTQRQDNRGIIVFINGRRANAASFYGANESSYAFSYLSGVLEADYLDDFEIDVIASDRASVNWEIPETEELKRHIVQSLSWVARDWRRKRDEEKVEQTASRTGRNFTRWTENQRGDDGSKLGGLLETLISSDVEMPEETLDSVLDKVESLVPDFARLHWRHLHDGVRDAAGMDYKRGDYIRAVDEAMKAYSLVVRTKSGTEAHDDAAIMDRSFGGPLPKLDVAVRFDEEAGDGTLTVPTLDNIRSGQHFLSKGLVAGFRNLAAHNRRSVLQEIGLLTDRDCLDMLSLVSHLWFRLDGSRPQRHSS